ncbi:MAG TPA: hypothetical protein VIL36_23025 [Acidimicrobiales bacterium]
MSDISDDDVSEQLDDEVLGDGDFPPDRYVDPDEGAGAPAPDVAETDDQGARVHLVDDGPLDDEGESVADAYVEDDVGALDPDDEFSGDETTRDVATEHVPPPAEEVALHVVDEDDTDL